MGEEVGAYLVEHPEVSTINFTGSKDVGLGIVERAAVTKAGQRQIKRVIATRIAAGDTKTQIKDRLVAEYGPAILAAPPHKGFGLVAWWLPVAGIVVAAVVVGIGAWRWARSREPAPVGPPLDPSSERRLDDELRRFEA